MGMHMYVGMYMYTDMQCVCVCVQTQRVQMHTCYAHAQTHTHTHAHTHTHTSGQRSGSGRLSTKRSPRNMLVLDFFVFNFFLSKKHPDALNPTFYTLLQNVGPRVYKAQNSDSWRRISSFIDFLEFVYFLSARLSCGCLLRVQKVGGRKQDVESLGPAF